MNQKPSNPLNDSEILKLSALCDRLVEETLEAEEHAELEQWLERSEAAREHYVRRMQLSASLHDYASEFQGADEVAPLVSTDSRRMLWPIAVAASVALSAFIVVKGGFLDAAKETGDPVAQVVASVDAEWGDRAVVPGSSLQPDRYHLLRGTADLEMGEGVKLSLRGPAKFELVNGNRVHLTSGKLVARIPEQALGFLVTTPQSEVVDLGTEFGLAVNDAGHTDVHVIDGLVEVYERRNPEKSPASGPLPGGIKIAEGQARRLETDGGFRLKDIPFHSRQEILGNQRFDQLGLRLLRGSIRVKDRVSKSDLKIPTSGQARIEVIPEKTGVLLEEETAVTFRSPGNYRYFGAGEQMIPAGAKVDSYLLHFRSTEGEPIRGVIKFDQPIVGLICEANQLAATDALVGLKGVNFPTAGGGFRGLEPHSQEQVQKLPSIDGVGEGMSPDEVTLSQDMTTLGLRVNVTTQGVDQLRVLILSKE
jgi:ferric-dicitrate binding protein FerR (iron transport regulator)